MKRILLSLAILALSVPSFAQFGRGGGNFSGLKAEQINPGTFPPGEFFFAPGTTVYIPTIIEGSTDSISNQAQFDQVAIDTTTLQNNIDNVSGGTEAQSFVYNTDDLTSLADGIKVDFNLTTAPVSGSLIVIMDGLVQRSIVDYTLFTASITFSTAPASDTGSLLAVYPSTASLVTKNNFYFTARIGNETNSSSYEVMSTFVFSDHYGKPNHVQSNSYKVSGGGTCSYRIYDVTNGLTITEITGVSSVSTGNIIEFSSFSNIPTAPAVFEYQALRTTGGTICRWEASTWEWF